MRRASVSFEPLDQPDDENAGTTYVPAPHVYSSLVAVKHTEWLGPHAILRTPLPRSDSTICHAYTHAARCEQLELRASVKQHGLQYLGHQLVRVIAMTQTTIDSLAPGVDITVVFALLHHGRVASERDRQSIGVVLLGGIELLRVDELLLQYSSRMDELEAANDD